MDKRGHPLIAPFHEAESARELRLSLTLGYNDQRVVIIDLLPTP
jgi:hypothetical protein